MRSFNEISQVKQNFPKYLEMYFKNELGNKIIWQNHVDYWIPRVKCFLRYEDMLRDPYNTLTKAIAVLNGSEEFNETLLKQSIDTYDFKKLAGRNRGQENQDSFFRKGVSGDWRNYFNYESATIFDRYAGDKLIQLGYESDRSWVTRFQ